MYRLARTHRLPSQACSPSQGRRPGSPEKRCHPAVGGSATICCCPTFILVIVHSGQPYSPVDMPAPLYEQKHLVHGWLLTKRASGSPQGPPACGSSLATSGNCGACLVPSCLQAAAVDCPAPLSSRTPEEPTALPASSWPPSTGQSSLGSPCHREGRQRGSSFNSSSCQLSYWFFQKTHNRS